MLQTLPRELITLIFTFLTEQDLGRVARVCRYFSSLLATFDKIVRPKYFFCFLIEITVFLRFGKRCTIDEQKLWKQIVHTPIRHGRRNYSFMCK